MIDPTSSAFPPAQIVVQRLLAEYRLEPSACRIDQPIDACGFSGALVLCVRAADDVYCLRRWPTRGLSPARLCGLHRFLQALGAAGIREIAAPLVSASGDTLILDSESMWQMEPWMPGTADFHQAPSEQRLRSAMQTLARIHLAADNYDCPADDRVWFARHAAAPAPACRERLDVIHNWSPTRCAEVRSRLTSESHSEFRRLADDVLRHFALARPPVEQQLRRLHDVNFRLHPCLRDVWHDHLLFSDDVLTGVIDPSAARTENVASDLSRLLGSLLGDDRARWESALAMYDELRPLSGDERRLVIALDRSSVLLSGLTWIDRRLSGQLHNDELPRVMPRLEAILQRLVRLVATL